MKNLFLNADCMDPEVGLPSYPDNHFSVAVKRVENSKKENDFSYLYTNKATKDCSPKWPLTSHFNLTKMNANAKVGSTELNPNISDLQIGKAGEYLVCADLILNGYVAYPSEQGLPYDIVLDIDGTMLKVQVKTTRAPRVVPQRASDSSAYIFSVGVNGKCRRHKKYKRSQVDLFALVSIDTMAIAYLPYTETKSTMTFRCPQLRGSYYDEQGQKHKDAVMELFDKGISRKDISLKLGMPMSNVYRYSSSKPVYKSNAPYFDDFPLNTAIQAASYKIGKSGQISLL